MCGEGIVRRQHAAAIANDAEDGEPKVVVVVQPTPRWLQRVIVNFRWVCGLVLFVNFLVFWAVPIFVQGQAWKQILCKPLRWLFAIVDDNKVIRQFAETYIYSKEVYTDFFVLAFLLILQSSTSVCLLFYWQVTFDTLPWWLIYAHYFQWVGLGGRGMGGAYTLAHKEGHHRGGGLYRPWIANTVGNFWENWMGHWYGNVPYNFSTSHVFLHHRLNGGKGDTFYQFDLDRSSWSDFLLYLYRIFMHMTAWSSLQRFKELSADGNKVMRDNYVMLQRGFISYWIVVPCLIVVGLSAAGCSAVGIAGFIFFVYLQPLFCMSFFLAFINYSLHGFLEFGADGEHIGCVQSTTIVDGEDDMFGEDDHMAHHYHSTLTHRELAAHHQTQRAEWARHRASVFRGMSIVELSVLMLLKEWRRLAERHYVDHSGTLTVAAAAELLEARARRTELSYEDYEFGFLPGIRARAAALVEGGVCSSLEQAYRHLAHHK